MNQTDRLEDQIVLFQLFDRSNWCSDSPRTSTPILERKRLVCAQDSPQYKSFCQGLERPLTKKKKKNMENMALPGEEFISGHLLMTKEEQDIFNLPIAEHEFKKTISKRIRNLLSNSYKKLMEKTSEVFSKMQIQGGGGDGFDHYNPDCGLTKSFVDLEDVRRSKNVPCHASKASIIIV